VPLEPVRGLQSDSLLGDEEHPDNTELLARLAERTGLVLDAPGRWVRERATGHAVAGRLSQGGQPRRGRSATTTRSTCASSSGSPPLAARR
jgi:hypothetical protein